eukprot:703212-Pelagomonas_calceolata.AAC.4
MSSIFLVHSRLPGYDSYRMPLTLFYHGLGGWQGSLVGKQGSLCAWKCKGSLDARIKWQKHSL